MKEYLQFSRMILFHILAIITQYLHISQIYMILPLLLLALDINQSINRCKIVMYFYHRWCLQMENFSTEIV